MTKMISGMVSAEEKWGTSFTFDWEGDLTLNRDPFAKI